MSVKKFRMPTFACGVSLIASEHYATYRTILGMTAVLLCFLVASVAAMTEYWSTNARRLLAALAVALAFLTAQHHAYALIAVPPLVQLAEPAVAVPVRLRFAILFPEQLQSHMLMTFQLAMDFGEIDASPNLMRRTIWARRKKQLIELPVIAVLRQRPVQAGSGGSFEVSMNGRLAD